jgi:hypothetical protein
MTGAKREERIGGLVFVCSFFALLLLACASFAVLLTLIPHSCPDLGLFFVVAALAGGVGTKHLFPRRLSVFIHELKHAIMSNLSGNRAKDLVVRSHRGSFTYAYTKDTAHMNAFISVAPYWMPLFTCAAALLAIAVAHDAPLTQRLIVGAAWGSDAALNFRDVSPVQTDLSQLRGGYRFGLAYLWVINVLVATLLLTWAFAGFRGLHTLLWEVSPLSSFGV